MPKILTKKLENKTNNYLEQSREEGGAAEAWAEKTVNEIGRNEYRMIDP